MLCSIGYIWWPYAFLSNCLLVDLSWPLHDLWPIMHFTLFWGSFCQIWWPQGISKEFDLWLTLADHDLWPQQCTALWSGVLLTKFGSHRAFLRQIDPWMTFNPRWGRFENMPTNLVDPSPTPMPSFSSIPQSMAKRIAGHTYIYTHTDSIILVV